MKTVQRKTHFGGKHISEALTENKEILEAGEL